MPTSHASPLPLLTWSSNGSHVTRTHLTRTFAASPVHPTHPHRLFLHPLTRPRPLDPCECRLSSLCSLCLKSHLPGTSIHTHTHAHTHAPQDFSSAGTALLCSRCLHDALVGV